MCRCQWTDNSQAADGTSVGRTEARVTSDCSKQVTQLTLQTHADAILDFQNLEISNKQSKLQLKLEVNTALVP